MTQQKLFRRISFVFFLFAVVSPPLVFAEGVESWEQQLNQAIDEANLSEEQKHHITKLDQWLFGEEGEVINTAAQLPMRIGRVDFDQNDDWIATNNELIRSVVFRENMTSVHDLKDADVVILQLTASKNGRKKLPNGFNIPWQLPKDIEVIKDKLGVPNCYIVTLVKDNTNLKSMITTGRKLSSPEDIANSIACINKGYFFHFGYRGVAELPNDIFTKKMKNSDNFAIDLGQILFPSPDVLSLDKAGMARSEIIFGIVRSIAERQ